MIFFSGLIMAAIGFCGFMFVCNPKTKQTTFAEDACAAMMMMGLGIAVIGALIWIGRALA
jgi:hypothetical protein